MFMLTPQQQDVQAMFKAFVDREIMPNADQYDREERTPAEIIQKMAQQGYLGMILPPEYDGCYTDMIAYGLLHEEIGRGCSSLRSLLTVHSMVAYALLKWGSQQQRKHWLPKLATGQALAAFALSEPAAGSDARSIETTAVRQDSTFVLNGQKKWITYGQIADIFLIFATYEGNIAAFLIEKHTPGLSIYPITGMLGTKASMLAELHLENCRIPQSHLVGSSRLGLASVGVTALDIGRYSVAWGCVGIARACQEASLRYTGERKQFGTYLKEHQLVQHMITDMVTHTKAARLLCLHAGHLKDEGSPETLIETWIAKYYASTTAIQIASDAVQLHGANGCSSNYAVQRYWRDAKIMEIIEGSTQIQQVTIAASAYQNNSY